MVHFTSIVTVCAKKEINLSYFQTSIKIFCQIVPAQVECTIRPEVSNMDGSLFLGKMKENEYEATETSFIENHFFNKGGQ